MVRNLWQHFWVYHGSPLYHMGKPLGYRRSFANHFRTRNIVQNSMENAGSWGFNGWAEYFEISSSFVKCPTESVEFVASADVFSMASAQDHLKANDYTSAKVICLNALSAVLSLSLLTAISSTKWQFSFGEKPWDTFWDSMWRQINIIFSFCHPKNSGRWSLQNHSSESRRPNIHEASGVWDSCPETWWNSVVRISLPRFGR